MALLIDCPGCGNSIVNNGQDCPFCGYSIKTGKTREEMEQELEELKDRLELLKLDEPMDVLSIEFEDWEAERNILEDKIEEIEEEIENM